MLQLPVKRAGALTEREQRIFDFINRNSAGVLASVTPDGQPHATVIYYMIDKDDFTISFLTKTGTEKHRNLVMNNHVELVIFESLSQTVAQVFGTAEEITDPDVINIVADNIFHISMETSRGGVPPIAKLNAGEFTVFTIIPSQIRIAYYRRPDSGGYSQVFESIESFDLKPTA